MELTAKAEGEERDDEGLEQTRRTSSSSYQLSPAQDDNARRRLDARYGRDAQADGARSLLLSDRRRKGAEEGRGRREATSAQ